MIGTDARPRVLVVTKDAHARASFQLEARNDLKLTMESDLLMAVNRLGLEEFDALVLDPDENPRSVLEALLGLLPRLPRVKVMLLQTKNGQRPVNFAGARPLVLSRNDFVRSVLCGLSAP
jgi:hypothetical protein